MRLVDFLIIAQVVLLLAAGFSDLVGRLISNRLCATLAVIGLLGRIPFGLPSVAISIGVSAILMLVLMVVFVRGWLGGGDVKLLVAMSLGLPPLGVVSLIYVMALAGGVLALLYYLMRRLPRPRPASSRSMSARIYAVERWRIFRHAPLPYGLAIAFGGIWAALTGV